MLSLTFINLHSLWADEGEAVFDGGEAPWKFLKAPYENLQPANFPEEPPNNSK